MANKKTAPAKTAPAAPVTRVVVATPKHPVIVLAAPATPVAAPAPNRSRRILEIKDGMAPTVAKVLPPKFDAAAFAKLTDDQLRAAILAETLTPDQLLAATTKLGGVAPGTTAKRKFEVVQTANGEFRKGTLTSRIYDFMQLPADQAMTLEQMRDQLLVEFPEKAGNPDGVMTTVRCQITRQPAERNFVLGRNAAGQYSVHIVGRDNSRVLSPEAQEKRDAKAKAKTDRAAEKTVAREAKAKLKADAKATAAAAKEAARLAAVEAAKVAAAAVLAAQPKVATAAAPTAAVVGKLAPKATVKK